MRDEYVEVTTQSWGERLGGAIKGILFGVFLVVVGVVLLFWNEGRSVKRAKTLEEGAGAVIAVEAAAVDPAHDTQLVHFTGRAITAETLVDPELGFAAQALRLLREVEMYQWVEKVESEERKRVGGGTETTKRYVYRTEWAPEAVDSGRFKVPEGHLNPPFELDDREWMARQITVGAFSLTDAFKSKLVRSERVRLSEENLAAVPEDLRLRLRLDGGAFYLGASPATPEIGDQRIHFELVEAAAVSIVGEQRGSEVVPYQTQAGGTIALVEYGTHPAAEMFAMAEAENVLWTWLLRLGGFLLTFIGFALILRPFSVVADVLPVVGNLVAKGTGLVALLVACLASLVTIALGWIYFRPLVGITLLVIAAVVIVGLIWLAVKRRKAAQAASPPPPPAPAAASPPPPPA